MVLEIIVVSWISLILADKDSATSESSQDGSIVLQGQYPVKVINASTLGLGQATSADGSTAAALQTITMTNAGGGGGTIVQYGQSQDGQQFFVPGKLNSCNFRQ